MKIIKPISYYFVCLFTGLPLSFCLFFSGNHSPKIGCVLHMGTHYTRVNTVMPGGWPGGDGHRWNCRGLMHKSSSLDKSFVMSLLTFVSDLTAQNWSVLPLFSEQN